MSSLGRLYFEKFGLTKDEMHRVRRANAKHPERKAGEVLFHNGDQAFFDHLVHQTKRLGQVAYDVNGNIIPGRFPIFLQEAELRERAANYLASRA